MGSLKKEVTRDGGGRNDKERTQDRHDGGKSFLKGEEKRI